jgi:hypothetical protein
MSIGDFLKWAIENHGTGLAIWSLFALVIVASIFCKH